MIIHRVRRRRRRRRRVRRWFVRRNVRSGGVVGESVGACRSIAARRRGAQRRSRRILGAAQIGLRLRRRTNWKKHGPTLSARLIVVTTIEVNSGADTCNVNGLRKQDQHTLSAHTHTHQEGSRVRRTCP